MDGLRRLGLELLPRRLAEAGWAVALLPEACDYYAMCSEFNPCANCTCNDQRRHLRQIGFERIVTYTKDAREAVLRPASAAVPPREFPAAAPTVFPCWFNPRTRASIEMTLDIDDLARLVTSGR